MWILVLGGYKLNEVKKKNENDKSISYVNLSEVGKKINTKKLIIILGVLIICLGAFFIWSNSLSEEEINNVINLSIEIDELSDYKLENDLQLQKAKAKLDTVIRKYDELNLREKMKLKNKSNLNEFKNAVEIKYIEYVENKIDNIGEVEIDPSFENKLTNIKKIYDELDDNLKSKITNYEKLEKAEKDLMTKRNEYFDCLLAELGDITIDSRDKIKEIRDFYESLSDEDKTYISSYNNFVEKENQYFNIAVEYCINEISNLGDITLEKKGNLEKINIIYQTLDDENKKRVTNYSEFENAYKIYTNLKSQDWENKKIENIKNTIKVTRCDCSRPNSAGGVDVYINFTNTSDKTIKYAYFTVEPYNAVGDIVESEVGNRTTAICTDTGPYGPGEGHYGTSWYWDCIWYNSTIVRIKLTKIRIEYTDGTQTSISGDDIQYVW